MVLGAIQNLLQDERFVGCLQPPPDIFPKRDLTSRAKPNRRERDMGRVVDVVYVPHTSLWSHLERLAHVGECLRVVAAARGPCD